MAVHCFRSSKPDEWVMPRPFRDPVARLRTYGPIRPMTGHDGLFGRLLSR